MSKRAGASSPTKRLLTELRTYHASPPPRSSGIHSLQPISTTSLVVLHAILCSPDFPPPYNKGRFLVSINVPPTYPLHPPVIRFITRICHPNVKWETGEICLDVLGENWTPVLGIVGALEAVGRLLGEPGTDSPLGLEVAALLRAEDVIGARGLVGFWCAEEYFEGELREVNEVG